MMKIICVGDNVVDCYLDQKLFYPGGNAVNVAVNCRRSGAELAAYIGIFGNDPEADHIRTALDLEDVTWERSRRVYAASGHPGVALTSEGDRVFVGGPRNTAQNIVRLWLTPPDLDYIGEFDICHSSCYSGLEPELKNIAARTDLSFDFSTRSEDAYIAEVACYTRFAFFSGAELTESRQEDIIRHCHDAGTEIVGITLGKRGALFSRNGTYFRQDIMEVSETVDTMGAGDSFIAGFLTRFHAAAGMEEALSYAAVKAAETCRFYGGFGYPHAFIE